MPGVIPLRNGACRATVSTAGGAILEAEVAGLPLLMPSETPGLATRLHGREGCFPLVPFGGRIERNCFRLEGVDYDLSPNTRDPLVLHGDGWLREWSVAEIDEESVRLVLPVEASDRSPYAYRAEQHIEARPDGLNLTLSVECLDSHPLPFGLGFHPYFPITPASTLSFEAGALWTERDLHLPGERREIAAPLDFTLPISIPDVWINNCYDEWQGTAVISQPSGHRLVLQADPVFDRLMVFKLSGQSPFLCLEPMSHRPNAHADLEAGGLTVLERGQRLSGSVAIRVERL